MMNKEELRLGDWVCVPALVYDAGDGDFSNGYEKITKLEEYEVWTTGLKEIGYDEIEPIPLTAEILEKNGWEKGGQLNLSPSHQYQDKNYTIAVNLDITAEKVPYIDVYNHISQTHVSLECEKAGYCGGGYKRSFWVHELQHILVGAGCNKEIQL